MLKSKIGLATLTVAVVIVTGIISGWWILKIKPYTAFHDASGLTFKYPKSLQIERPNPTERSNGLLLKMAQPQKESRQFLLTVGFDDGLSKPVSIQHISSLDYMLAGIRGLYPERYQNYHEEQFKKFSINGHQAADLTITIDNNSARLKERILLVAKDKDKVMNLTVQARRQNFDALNQEYFDPIFQSVRID